jgi:peptidoglycan/LPS O-acetylase OafA/YrhL
MGWIGVDLFFVLSGFLITGNLIRARKYQNYYQVFYFHRALRIFPLYYLVLAVTLLFAHQHYGFSEQIWFWLNLSNIPTAFNPYLIAPLAHFWSLAIEEQFYMIWPTVIRKVDPRPVAIICFVVIATLFIVRNLPASIALHYRHTEIFYRLTPFRIDTLCAGAALAIIVNQNHTILTHRWKLRSIFLCSAIAFLVVGYGHMPGTRAIIRLGYTLLVIAFTSLIALVVSKDGMTRRVFSNRFLRKMGSYSYCFYLIHPAMLFVGNRPFLSAYVARMLHVSNSSNLIWVVIAAGEFVIDLTVCAFSYHFFEQPILRLKRLYPYRDLVRSEMTAV